MGPHPEHMYPVLYGVLCFASVGSVDFPVDGPLDSNGRNRVAVGLCDMHAPVSESQKSNAAPETPPCEFTSTRGIPARAT